MKKGFLIIEVEVNNLYDIFKYIKEDCEGERGVIENGRYIITSALSR